MYNVHNSTHRVNHGVTRLLCQMYHEWDMNKKTSAHSVYIIILAFFVFVISK